MSEFSVSAISLPRLSGTSRKFNLARRSLLAVFERLQVGSLTLHEDNEVSHFGDVSGAGPHGVVVINDQRVWQSILSSGALGCGEAYMQAYWSSPGLVDVVRVFCANMSVMQQMETSASPLRRLALKLAHFMNNNSLRGSRRNISAHYDLGNDFFKLFLDQSMMYSSAVFETPETSLEEAAEYKLELMCQQLELKPEDHLLEIGTGWGGMAMYAAKNYGCKVTTTTLSREQYDYARQRIAEAGLQDRIEVLCEDYRDLSGNYDKLVSIEMIEAVGHQFYQNYFSKCSSLLKPDGLMAIQAITMTDQRYEQAKETVDFIKRYIFPGGCLPSVAVIGQHLADDTDMQMTHLRDIALDYAETLAHWRSRFIAALPEVRDQGFDETFERMWDFYLCYCEGGFRERIIGTVQLTFAKPGYRPARG